MGVEGAYLIRVWGRPTSTCTERVLWGLAEAEAEFDLVLASNFMGPDGPVAKGHAPYGIVGTPEYLALNPNGTIPTIDDGGTVVWDSNAILVHLATKPGPLHLDAAALVRAVQWMGWTNEHLEPPLHTLVMHLVRLPSESRDPAQVEAARAAILRPLALLDAQLRDRDFVCGPRFTIGDIPAGVSYHRWTLFGLDAPRFDRLQAWHARLMERDGYRRHVEPAAFHVAGR